MTSGQLIEPIVAAVLASPRYRDLSAELVRNLAEREAAKGRPRKEAIKAVKNKLHQVAGAYLADGTDRGLPYATWLESLRAASSDVRPSLCQAIMRHHASTRERLPYLDQFSTVIGADLPPVRSIADLACGLNPLALPLLPLAPGATLFACDLYPALLAFLGAAMPLLSIPTTTAVLDLTQTIPTGHYDLALLLKLIPCLDQIDRTAAPRLLDGLDADHMVISFPTRALGGRDVGMAATYDARLRELLAGRARHVRRHTFPTEIVYVVQRATS